MQTTATNTTATQSPLKAFKKWCIIATRAAKEAAKEGIPAEQYSKYVAADNMAKQYRLKLQVN